MENIKLNILLIIIGVIILILLWIFLSLKKRQRDIVKNPQKKFKSMSDKSIEILEKKKSQNDLVLGKKGFKVYRQLISPVETIRGVDNVKIVTLDFTNYNMAITQVSTTSKVILPKIYDIKNIIDVKLIVNDKEYSDEIDYDNNLKSLMIKIKARDAINPQYFIPLLPKAVAVPNKTFEEDYLDYALAIVEELDKIVKKNME